jgi:hypothetical protein
MRTQSRTNPARHEQRRRGPDPIDLGEPAGALVIGDARRNSLIGLPPNDPRGELNL